LAKVDGIEEVKLYLVQVKVFEKKTSGQFLLGLFGRDYYPQTHDFCDIVVFISHLLPNHVHSLVGLF